MNRFLIVAVCCVFALFVGYSIGSCVSRTIDKQIYVTKIGDSSDFHRRIVCPLCNHEANIFSITCYGSYGYDCGRHFIWTDQKGKLQSVSPR
jgi:hypothetical protein